VTSVLEGAEAGLSARVSATTLEALVEAYSRPALLALPPAAEGALAGLTGLVERGLTLAVVSNTMRSPGSTLRKVLAAHGLLDIFAHLTFSDEVGVRKPAKEIFLLTLERLGAAPSEAVHVGDDDVLDVAGARGAGLRAIQVRRVGQAAGAHAPDVVIDSLAALPGAVEKVERLL
jgi:putative hydrolase of the HAD superfamily